MQIVNGIGVDSGGISKEYCHELIRYFYKRTDLWKEGITLEGENRDKKDAFQLSLKGSDQESILYQLFKDSFIRYLEDVNKNIKNWNYKSLFARGTNQVGLKLQRYIKQEGHYKAVHQERDGTFMIKRMFVVMAYLNDVEDGGTTVFPYFNLSYSPGVGDVLVWPAGFPYLHYGEVPLSNNKYIATSWIEQLEG